MLNSPTAGWMRSIEIYGGINKIVSMSSFNSTSDTKDNWTAQWYPNNLECTDGRTLFGIPTTTNDRKQNELGIQEHSHILMLQQLELFIWFLT